MRINETLHIGKLDAAQQTALGLPDWQDTVALDDPGSLIDRVGIAQERLTRELAEAAASPQYGAMKYRAIAAQLALQDILVSLAGIDNLPSPVDGLEVFRRSDWE